MPILSRSFVPVLSKYLTGLEFRLSQACEFKSGDNTEYERPTLCQQSEQIAVRITFQLTTSYRSSIYLKVCLKNQPLDDLAEMLKWGKFSFRFFDKSLYSFSILRHWKEVFYHFTVTRYLYRPEHENDAIQGLLRIYREESIQT